MCLALIGIQLQNLCTSCPSWNVLSFHSSSFTTVPATPVLEGHRGMVLKRMYGEGKSRGKLADRGSSGRIGLAVKPACVGYASHVIISTVSSSIVYISQVSESGVIGQNSMCVLLGQKKLFHVKEYLSPKDLQEKGLTPILDAMEVADYMHPGVKKRLLRYVWPDSSRTFEEVFTPYIKERGAASYLQIVLVK